MSRKRYELTDKQIKELQGAYHQSKDGPTRTRYQAVRLYAQGYRVTEILTISGCSRTRLLEWWRSYRHQGLRGLEDKRAGGNAAKLSPHQREDLRHRLELYTPRQLFGSAGVVGEGQFWTVADLKRAVEQWYGVSYSSATTYQRLLAKCGFSYQRPDKVYKSRQMEQVLEFAANLDKKLVDVAQEAPQTVILAEDEAGLYLQATLTRVWAPVGQTPIIPVTPDRQMVKFYGTLNLFNGEQIVTRADTMNAQATADHLTQILAAIPDHPLLLLWDRAPWHFGPPIRQVLADHPRLEIMLLPVASPDLNPQEHVWKAARNAISHNHLTPRLADLADDFETYLTSNTFETSFLDQYALSSICPVFN
jgi:transposase